MNDFMNAIDDLVKEKGITKELLMEAIESALVAAYKKNYGTAQNVRVVFEDGMEGIEVLMRKDVVEEVEDEFTQISLEDALDIDPRYQVGDVVEYQVTPQNFGRIAAQTAKQVVVQKIREAERGMVFDNYIERQSKHTSWTFARAPRDPRSSFPGPTPDSWSGCSNWKFLRSKMAS